MNDETITVPIEFSAHDIKFLARIMNDSDDSELCMLAESILRKVDSISIRMGMMLSAIERENPFSAMKMRK